ncbi:hypothetical protein TBR22_A37630 [Luteitalea sp. TBR-22]|uniref:protein kinase domain-containing protein n=1 Tax=Luteitalea sp. TBR-22 TaxID=2802971 RepID=UPI001AF934BE|nr:serine/threonine-protein kinase [Luteitalea sp. TBR-22]BCS34535.1 hypothetical protein TBR22_A37630 [Luteitalea sp. TBR-22]
MNAARHARAKSIFLEASRCAPEERPALLARLCGDDTGLRAEVEGLLGFHDDRTDGGWDASSPAPPPIVVRHHEVATGELSPGDLFAGRYRIDACIGRGGMGAVYKVFDTLLALPVALKVVHTHADRDGNRLLQEVRLARAITHPAVCRTYDAGEVEGRRYFTMEYVDGEDLATLLRRVGRLPPSRVATLARQLCAGLAAAHARGVLHRDLKPANVMLDRRGDIRITDFGIAVAMGPSTPGRQMAGTPAYMAPEVLAGGPASQASDVHALGIVLYELLTGAHPASAAAHPGAPIPRPSQLVSDVPAGLDEVIMAALAPVSARPASALALAAALPGGDVLALARDAGLTPPPQVVAGAGGLGALAGGEARRWLAVWAIGLVIVMGAPGRRALDRLPMEDPPAVLAAQAEARLRTVAAFARPARWTHRFQPAGASGLEWMAPAGDPAEGAWVVYREGPASAASGGSHAGRRDDLSVDTPMPVTPGSAAVAVNARGHLRRLRIVPLRTPAADASAAVSSPWAALWAWSGIDPASVVTETATGTEPQPFADRVWAWTGRLTTGAQVRIEAATLGGTLTMFRVLPPGSSVVTDGVSGADAGTVVPIVLALALTAGGLALAWRNVRSGRGDGVGATRLGGFTFVVLSGTALLDADWRVLGTDPQLPWTVAGMAMVGAALTGIFYLASEPTVRRHWPESLVAWTRLMAGRVRDPRVGREVLVGATMAVALAALGGLLPAAAVPPSPQDLDAAGALMGSRHLVAAWLDLLPRSVLGGMIHAVLFALAVRGLGRRDLAVVASGGLFVLLGALSGSTGAALVIEALLSGVRLVLLTRVGLLALVGHLYSLQVVTSLPLALRVDWRLEYSLTTALMLTALVITAARVAIGRSGFAAERTATAPSPRA